MGEPSLRVSSRPGAEASALRPPTRPRARQLSRWRQQAQALQKEVLVAWFVLNDRRTPWYARAVAAFAVGYLFSPVQLIPSFIPVIGFMDDFLVLGVGMRLIRWLTAQEVLDEARSHARSAISPGNQNIKPLVVRAAVVVIAGVWFLVTIAIFFWLRRP